MYSRNEPYHILAHPHASRECLISYLALFLMFSSLSCF